VDHFVAAKRTAAEVQFQPEFLHEVEEMVEVEIRIRFAFEIQNSGGIFRAGWADQMRRPLNVSGDVLESGFFKLEKDRLPVTGLEAEVLNFASEDVGAIVCGFGFHQVCMEKKVSPSESKSIYELLDK
jgi:hypothetical protein